VRVKPLRDRKSLLPHRSTSISQRRASPSPRLVFQAGHHSISGAQLNRRADSVKNDRTEADRVTKHDLSIARTGPLHLHERLS
jgi:hypothetical protein